MTSFLFLTLRQKKLTFVKDFLKDFQYSFFCPVAHSIYSSFLSPSSGAWKGGTLSFLLRLPFASWFSSSGPLLKYFSVPLVHIIITGTTPGIINQKKGSCSCSIVLTYTHVRTFLHFYLFFSFYTLMNIHKAKKKQEFRIIKRWGELTNNSSGRTWSKKAFVQSERFYILNILV